MMISDGRLRTYLDHELPEEDARMVEEALMGDPHLQGRLDRLAGREEECRGLLSRLDAESLPQANPRAAIARGRRRAQKPSRVWLRPAWGALAASVAIAVLLPAWPPAQAAAQRILGLLRFESVAVLKLDRHLLSSNGLSDTQAQTFAQVLSDSVEKIKEPADDWEPASREEAQEIAGFSIRLPRDRFDEPKFKVSDAQAFAFTVERVRVEQLIDIVGGTDIEVPSRLDGARVRVDIFKTVEACYGGCWPPSETDSVDWTRCLWLQQGPTPAVVSVPEIDLGEIAELGLQVAGMSREDASGVRSTVDWASTLVIPMPEDEAHHEEIDVDGVRGVLMTDFRRQRRDERPNEYAIIWVKYGMTYMLVGFGDPWLGVDLANNLTE